MNKICLIFQIHQPIALRTFRYFEVSKSKPYWDSSFLEKQTHEFANNVILPNNELLSKLIRQTKGALKFSFYISGPALDLLLTHAPEAINSLRTLSDSGAVEFTGGTSSHSIVSLVSQPDELKKQIKTFRARMEYFFDQSPQIFVNADLIYNNRIAEIVAGAGYPAVVTNGTSNLLQGRSPNYLYRSSARKPLKIFLRNEVISNFVSEVLANPVAPEANVLLQGKALFDDIPEQEPITVVYLNYPDLNRNKNKAKDHQRFLADLINWLSRDPRYSFEFPSKLAEEFAEIDQLSIDDPICWHEHFHPDYYPGNDLQKDAMNQLFKFTRPVNASTDFDLKTDWQYLQCTDYFHLMDDNFQSYKTRSRNSVSFSSKYDAYINYMNILDDFRHRLDSGKKMNTGSFLPGEKTAGASKHPLTKK